jgi:hypothetical protein
MFTGSPYTSTGRDTTTWTGARRTWSQEWWAGPLDRTRTLLDWPPRSIEAQTAEKGGVSPALFVVELNCLYQMFFECPLTMVRVERPPALSH